MGNSNIHDRSGSLGDDVLQRLQQVEDISDSIPFDPLDTQRRLMSRPAHASSHAPGKTPGKALAGKASRSRRELASPDDISNTMSLLACTDATHTASCRSAGLARDPRGKDAAAAAQRAQAQLPVIEDSTCMSPYYGVPPPAPVRPDNSHTGALPDNPESPVSSQALQGREAADQVVPEPDAPARPPVAAAAVAPPPPAPPRKDVCPTPRQDPPADMAHPPEPAHRPTSWRPEPPIPAPARLHHPARGQGARTRVEAPPADFLAAPQPVDKVLLDRFLTAAADTPGLPEDARELSTTSSTGSAAQPAATLSRAASPGKPVARNPAATAAMYLTPRRGTRTGEASAMPNGGRPQQHAQSAISALYRFATLAAERRAGGNATAPSVPPLAPPARRSSALPRHSLSNELRPLLQEDSMLSPGPHASVATATPRDEPSPRRRARSASRNRRAWGCGPRASLACICGMPDVDEGSSFDMVPLVPTDAELSTRGTPRQRVRAQQPPQHASPLLQSGRHEHNHSYAMYQGATSAGHARRSPLSSPSVGAATPRQSHARRSMRMPPQSGHAISAVPSSARNSLRTNAATDPSRMPSQHWRDTNRQELSGVLKQGSPLRYSEDAARGSCRRCGVAMCRCSARRTKHVGPASECTPRTGFGSPRMPLAGYTSQPLRSPRPDSPYAGTALHRSDSQPVNVEALHGIASHSRMSRGSVPQRMLGALGEYRGTRAAPVRPGPFGGPTESQPFRTMQQAMAAQVPPTAAVAAQRVQGGFRPMPQRLEATSSWALSAALAAQSMTTAPVAVAGSESGESDAAEGVKGAGAGAAQDAPAEAVLESAATGVPEAANGGAVVEAPEADAAEMSDERMHAAAVPGSTESPPSPMDGACMQLEPPQGAAAAGRPTSQPLVVA